MSHVSHVSIYTNITSQVLKKQTLRCAALSMSMTLHGDTSCIAASAASAAEDSFEFWQAQAASISFTICRMASYPDDIMCQTSKFVPVLFDSNWRMYWEMQRWADVAETEIEDYSDGEARGAESCPRSYGVVECEFIDDSVVIEDSPMPRLDDSYPTPDSHEITDAQVYSPVEDVLNPYAVHSVLPPLPPPVWTPQPGDSANSTITLNLDSIDTANPQDESIRNIEGLHAAVRRPTLKRRRQIDMDLDEEPSTEDALMMLMIPRDER